MKNIKKIALNKLQDSDQYQPFGSDIYKDLQDEGGFALYRLAVSMELETGESSQYPLEDVLDKYLVHVEEFLDGNTSGPVLKLLMGGELDSLRNFLAVLGKRAYNVNYTDDNGDERVKLVIE